VNTSPRSGVIGAALCGVLLVVAGAWHAGASSAPAIQTAQPQPPVVATVNMDRLFQPQVRDFADRVSEFEARLAQWDKDIADLTARIQKLQDDLETLELSPEQRREKATELFELEAQRQSKREILQRRAQFEEGEIYRLIYIHASEIIREVAQQEGYDLVFFDDRQTPPIGNSQAVPATSVKSAIGNRTVLHVGDSLDATDLVIARYNNEYDAGRWAK